MKNRPLHLPSILLAAILSFFLGWFSAQQFGMPAATNPDSQKKFQTSIQDSGTTSNPPTARENLRIRDLDDVWEKLQKSYYDQSKLDLPKLEWGAVQGFVEGVGDRYTVFMTPEESKDFHNGLDGLLEGIGAELEVKDGALTILRPLKNSPAEEAGILPGDVIEKIDGELAANLTLSNAIRRIRGKKGTKVTLTILRKSETKPLTIVITRREITLNSVELKKLAGDIWHLELIQFNDQTEREFESAISKLLLEKAKGLILDLRGNGGGYLDVSIDMLSELFNEKETAVIVKHRDMEKNETLKTAGSGRLGDMPLAVLVDGGSASASEIVAGALQDHKRGFVIGEKTFGKGSVQEIEKLQDGSSLRLTVAKWFTPQDRSIDETGIAPDLEVKITEEDIKAKRDPQLEEAVRHLLQKKSPRL